MQIDELPKNPFQDGDIAAGTEIIIAGFKFHLPDIGFDLIVGEQGSAIERINIE